jgi:transposase-like protein
MASQGNRYNEELKADIIRLIQEEKQPVNKVAKDFGINDQTIRNWLKAVEDKKVPENSRIAELEAQLKEERRKTADLQQTVDILKKSVAIFVQDNRK